MSSPIQLASSTPAPTSVPGTLISLVPYTASSSESEADITKCVKTILIDESLHGEATTIQQEPNQHPHKMKTKPVSVPKSNGKQINTIQNYVTKKSTSTKRKLSGESTCPSSVRIVFTMGIALFHSNNSNFLFYSC